MILNTWKWNERYAFSSDDLSHRLQLLAVRRFIFAKHSVLNLLGENWMQSYSALLQENYLESAKYSLHQLKNLSTMNPEMLLIKESQLLSKKNEISQAITLLEPKFINIPYVIKLLKFDKKKSSLKSSKSRAKFLEELLGNDRNEEKFHKLYELFIQNESNRSLLAEKLFLSTRLMTDSQLINGRNILERFSTIIHLAPTFDISYLEYAKYLENLSNDLLNKENYLTNITLTTTQKNTNSSAKTLRGTTTLSDDDDEDNEERLKRKQIYHQPGYFSYQYLDKAIEMYGNCIKYSGSYNIIVEVLPKFLTLWLGFTAQSEPPAVSGNSKKSSGSPLQLIQDMVNEKIAKLIDEIPANVWYMGITQIISRILHPNLNTTQNLEKLLLKILLVYPKQSIWHIASLIFSLNKERKAICRKILNYTYKRLLAEFHNEKDANMLLDSQKLFMQLIQLAAFQTKEKKTTFKLENITNIHEFVIPTKTVLLNSSFALSSATFNVNGSVGSISYTFSEYSRLFSKATAKQGNLFQQEAVKPTADYSSSHFLFINFFHEQVTVAASKAKPKTIVIESTCGKKIKFLCKMEKDGDLRKDAHLMEFNSTINRLFMQNVHSRKRKLRLRTYAVVCLHEESGLLEWVNNTECLRQAITDSHLYYHNPIVSNVADGKDILMSSLLKPLKPNTTYATDFYPNLTYKEVYNTFLDFQAKYEDNLTEMTKAYQALIYEVFQYHPCFHRWFFELFPNPTDWLESRTIYSRSVAVWAAVGYIIGLGDRHTENILLDTTNGECVHVDFDCLFDKGLTLAKPEIVPFRLTSNMIDAMGIMGIEGNFRQTLEICLTVLRENREKLLNILEPFLRDPTVAWSRSGRAQKPSDSSVSNNSNATEAAGDTSKQIQDTENKEAKEMLLKISDRLKGVYNILHPQREKFIRGSTKRGEPMPTKGLGPSKEELLPLSVSGQAQKLIDEATADENLSQLYIGMFSIQFLTSCSQFI
jgi:serine/threonine-protein kinase ATR